MTEQTTSREPSLPDSQTESALQFCRVRGLTPAVVAVHQEVARDYLARLLSYPDVCGAIAPPADVAGATSRIGCYRADAYTWEPPNVASTCIVLLGPRSAITYRMARAARRAGVPWLVYSQIDRWHAESTRQFILRKYFEKLQAISQRYARAILAGAEAWFLRLPGGHYIAERLHHPRRIARYSRDWISSALSRIVSVRAATQASGDDQTTAPSRLGIDVTALSPMDDAGYGFAIQLPQIAGESDSLRHPGRSPWILLEDGVTLPHAHANHEEIRTHGGGRWSHWGRWLYFSSSDGTDPRSNGKRYELVCYRHPMRRLRAPRNPFEALADTVAKSDPGAIEFVKDRILLVNSSLASGGAERQVVNTLLGVKKRGYCDLTLLCEHLHDRPAHDFYLWMLEKEAIEVRQIDRTPAYMVQLMSEERLRFATPFLSLLPVNLRDEVAFFAYELLRLRPSVVHAWQDQTSVKVGLAAALIGVPRIVLGSRNLPPYHFHYYLQYMAPAYRALAANPSIVFTNNSRKGAKDYEKWLGLAPGTFQVVFNGVDDASMRRQDSSAVAHYRRHLNIPQDAPVVGGMFRLYPEKDPLLWLKTARRVLDRKPDTYFLLVGIGVLQEQIEAAAERLGLRDRLIMPGTEKLPALPLSAMDVFLLTSKQEGTPNVVIEAQMTGVPVVATDAGGTADTLNEGVTGNIVRSRRPQDLAAAVLKWLDDDCARSRVRVDAPSFAQGRFGFEAMVDATLQSYGLPTVAGCNRANS